MLVLNVVSDTSEVCILQVSVEIDLYNTIANGIGEFLLGAAGATVEHQEHWLVLLEAFLLLDILLMLLKEFWVELDISWLVDTVNVSETRSNGEVGRDLLQGSVDLVDILGLSVERVVINILIVDTVLFTTSDTNFLDFVSRVFSSNLIFTYHL